MLMSLGFLTFERNTLPFDSRKRSIEARWGSSNRVGKRPVHQYLGPGDETLSLEATLYPELTGPDGLNTLRSMAEQGKAWLLVDGDGTVWPDAWIIDKIDENQTHFTPDGVALKSTVTLSLKRYDGQGEGGLGDGLGNLPDSDPALMPRTNALLAEDAQADDGPFAAVFERLRAIRDQLPPEIGDKIPDVPNLGDVSNLGNDPSLSDVLDQIQNNLPPEISDRLADLPSLSELEERVQATLSGDTKGAGDGA